MAWEKEKPKFNSTFTEISKWKSDESKDKYIVFSRITNNDNGEKTLFLNEKGTTRDGKTYSKKGVVIPPRLASVIGDALKIAGNNGGQ